MRYDDYPWYASLLALPGLGVVSLARALRSLGSARAIANADPSELIASGMRQPVAEACAALAEPADRFKRQADWLSREQVRLLSCNDDDYPPQLSAVPAAPAVLFVQGDAALLSTRQLALVGSRRPTAVGRETARRLAADVAAAGMTVTSGLALGIDAAAHRGTLDAGGCTVAVTATGSDIVYPRRHRPLAQEILACGGVVVTEFLPGTQPDATHFPRRNRIISGLSLGVLVVEAALPSGSLITAQYAAEQGREVMAVPGSIHCEQSRGTNNLIRHGAALIDSAADVMAVLGLDQPPAEPVQRPAPGRTDPLLEHIGFEPTPVGVLAARVGAGVATLMPALARLELGGLVEICDGSVQRAPSTLARRV